MQTHFTIWLVFYKVKNGAGESSWWGNALRLHSSSLAKLCSALRSYDWATYIVHNVQYNTGMHAKRLIMTFARPKQAKFAQNSLVFDPHLIETGDSNHSPRKIRDKK